MRNRQPAVTASFASVAAAAASSIALAGAGEIVAHWTFDQTGQGIALDSVGGMHGTLNSGATMVAGGLAGGAVHISSANGGLVDMGQVLPLLGTQPCTITAWVNLSSAFTANAFPIAHHTAGTFNGFFMCINPSGCYGAPAIPWSYRSNSCGQEAKSTTAVNDNAWHFVAITYHPTTGNRIYVDGGPAEGTGVSTQVNANNARLIVGGLMVGGSPINLFDGLIDDVQIYTRALTCEDINQMFASPGSEANPVTPDLNGDGDVNGADLGIMLSAWTTPAADLNGDGTTDGADLGVLLSGWGVCP